jgi:hypothetical protein
MAANITHAASMLLLLTLSTLHAATALAVAPTCQAQVGYGQ